MNSTRVRPLTAAMGPSVIVSSRLTSRIVRHHLPLFLFSAIATLSIYITRSYKDVPARISFATAYPALVLLAATLLIGPINSLRGSRNPVSSDLRRDFGIWDGILGLLHAVVGQCVHLRGRPWLYYVYGPTEHHHGIRHDLFGLANYSGALATLLLIALLSTSNDFSLRALGTPRWKSLQRWNYVLFALVAVHTFAYQGVEKQKLVWVGTALGCVAITLALQIIGFMRRRRGLRELSASGRH